MKLISEQFRKGGADYRQIERLGNVAIFEQRKPHWKNPAFEVIIIRTAPAHEAFGKTFPEAERYPASEDWGKHGWTYTNLESAKRRFALLKSEPQ